MQEKETVSKLTLYSILPPQAILSQLEAGFIASPSDREALQRAWEKARAKYAMIGPPSRSFITPEDVQPVEKTHESRARAVLQKAKCYAPYDSHPTEIAMVKISKLVTPQITINLARAERRAAVKPDMTTEDLISLMFESGGTPEVITRQALGFGPNGGAVLFTSSDEDVRVHHPPRYKLLPISDQDTESPLFDSLYLPVGGGLPFAAAFRIEIAPGVTRLFLNNGIHRTYQLARAGYEWCPTLLSDLIPIELQDPFVNLPRDMLLPATANPPLITDFLNEDVTIQMEYFRVLKTIRINWQFEQYVTVLH